MGNGMNKILPGLFLGNFKDARDTEQLKRNNITHILSIHDTARAMLEVDNKLHNLVESSSRTQDLLVSRDLMQLTPNQLRHISGSEISVHPCCRFTSQNLTRHFKESIAFIHECRLKGEGCLVHCLAGVSRSATLVVAYIMTITEFGWEDALSVVRASRSCANPNAGFQRQLEEFEKNDVADFREWLKAEYGESSLQDKEEAQSLLEKYKAHAASAAAQSNTFGRQWNGNFAPVTSLSMTTPD